MHMHDIILLRPLPVFDQLLVVMLRRHDGTVAEHLGNISAADASAENSVHPYIQYCCEQISNCQVAPVMTFSAAKLQKAMYQ